jgi:hypothetical protein
MDFLSPSSDSTTWDAPDLPLGSVAWLVPNSGEFATFTRLFHPVSGGANEDADTDTQWRDLAATHGREWHPEIQFASLASPNDPHQARLANLGQARIERVLRHVVEAAGEDVTCIAALCDIDTWASPLPNSQRDDGTFGVSRDALTQAGRLTGPPPLRRTYHRFEIRASAVSRFGVNVAGAMFIQTQPTLLIATDGSFCLATDPDYDSTILAGSHALQNRILRDQTVESLAIAPTASLLHDADHINAPRSK